MYVFCKHKYNMGAREFILFTKDGMQPWTIQGDACAKMGETLLGIKMILKFYQVIKNYQNA